MNLNKVMLIGNLTRNPEVKTIPSGHTVATFGVATNRVWTDQNGQKQEQTEFHNIVAWRRLGEICGQYLRKGSKVYIEGRLQTRNYIDKDGIKRYWTEIIAENMIILDNKSLNSAPTPPIPPVEQSYAINNEPIITEEQPVQSIDEDQNPIEEEIKVENVPF